MTLSKFLTYWSLTFAIVLICIFSIAVALADVKDELLDKIQKQWATRAKARMRPIDPLADRSPAETLMPRALDEKESWVLHLVSQIAIALKLNVRILVLQDSQGHYLVHFAQGKRLTSYRVDKAWVADAMAGKADQRERIFAAVEQYLRQEVLGEPPRRAAPAPATGPASPAQKAPGPSPGASQGAQVPASSGVSPAAAGAEMSREERIAAAKAKAEAIKAQRGAAQPSGAGAPEGSKDQSTPSGASDPSGRQS